MGRKEGKREGENGRMEEKQRKSRRGYASREAHLGCIVLVLVFFCVIKREKLDEARLTLISRRKIK